MAESKLPLVYQLHVVKTNTTCTASLWLPTKSLTTTQTKGNNLAQTEKPGDSHPTKKL
jgi:hypothetical protein